MSACQGGILVIFGVPSSPFAASNVIAVSCLSSFIFRLFSSSSSSSFQTRLISPRFSFCFHHTAIFCHSRRNSGLGEGERERGDNNFIVKEGRVFSVSWRVVWMEWPTFFSSSVVSTLQKVRCGAWIENYSQFLWFFSLSVRHFFILTSVGFMAEGEILEKTKGKYVCDCHVCVVCIVSFCSGFSERQRLHLFLIGLSRSVRIKPRKNRTMMDSP